MNSFSTFNPERAETLALLAINFILGDEHMQQGFLASSGVSPNDFQNMIEDPNFLGGVLDFLLNNEEQLFKFCEENEIDPTEPGKARFCFPGATVEI